MNELSDLDCFTEDSECMGNDEEIGMDTSDIGDGDTLILEETPTDVPDEEILSVEFSSDDNPPPDVQFEEIIDLDEDASLDTPEDMDENCEYINPSDTSDDIVSILESNEPEILTPLEFHNRVESMDNQMQLEQLREDVLNGAVVLDTDDTDDASGWSLSRDITPEIAESRERDTRETLDNYAENLRDHGANEEDIERFISETKARIDAEYIQLDAGKEIEYLHCDPSDWAVAADELRQDDSLEYVEEKDGIEISYETSHPDIPCPADDTDDNKAEESKGTEFKTGESLEQLIIPEDTKEEDSQNEVSNEVECEERFEGEEYDEECPQSNENIMDGQITEIPTDVMQESLASFDVAIDDNSNNNGIEDIEYLEDSDSTSDKNFNLLPEIGVEMDLDACSDSLGGELEEGKELEENETIDSEILENPEDREELCISDDFTQIYDDINQNVIQSGYEGIDLPIDSEDFCQSLDLFQDETWEKLSLQEQKDAMENLSEQVSDILSIDSPPSIRYYHGREGDFGGYDRRDNTLNINEDMLYDADEAADTIAHELWHCHQYHCAENPKTARDYAYQSNFENYITPDMDIDGYSNQLVEAEARGFAAQLKELLSGRRAHKR